MDGLVTEFAPSAEVIADSISEDGHRLTTMVCTFHRFVLAEFNTHRMFSRSSASSRAIPVERQLARVSDQPAWPLEWPSEQPGMQGGTLLAGSPLDDAQLLFHDVWFDTIKTVSGYLEAHPEKSDRLHKSLINRLLEPFQAHTVIVSSTEWENYFRQRVSALAQPEIRAVAELMLAAYDESVPRELDAGEWHLPFIRDEEHDEFDLDPRKRVSVGRCARVSYLNHDGERDIDADLKLYERLVSPGDGPAHAAPLEHVATPDRGNAARVHLRDGKVTIALPGTERLAIEEDPKFFTVPLLGNFVGWNQLRHMELGF